MILTCNRRLRAKREAGNKNWWITVEDGAAHEFVMQDAKFMQSQASLKVENSDDLMLRTTQRILNAAVEKTGVYYYARQVFCARFMVHNVVKKAQWKHSERASTWIFNARLHFLSHTVLHYFARLHRKAELFWWQIPTPLQHGGVGKFIRNNVRIASELNKLSFQSSSRQIALKRFSIK